MRRIASYLVILLATAGCATVTIDRDPRHWHELRSEHFTVDTDLDLDSARQMTVQLERLRLGLLVALQPGLEVKQRVQVIVLADLGELRTFEDLPPSGYTNRSAQLLVVGSPNRAVQEWLHMHALQIHAHELAHELSYFVIPNQPRWIAEGIASRLETIELSPDGTEATIGKPFAPNAWFLGQFGPAKLSDMWAWRIPAELAKDDFKSENVLYPSAWAWVSWLMTKQPERFADFVRRDAAGEAPQDAFNEAFPPDVLLDSRRGVALAALKYSKIEVLELPTIHPEITASDLSAAEVHALVARLWATGPWKIDDATRSARVMAEVKQALAADPKDFHARELELTWSPADRKVALARRLAEDNPRSAEAWAMLVDALERNRAATPEGTEALERALALGPSDARVLNSLAWALLRRNELDRAASLASRALAEQPWNAAILDTRAAILFRQGRCTAAANLERAAINAPEAGGAPENQKRLEVLLSSCHEMPDASGNTERP